MLGRNAARIALKIAYGYEGVTEDEDVIRGGVAAMEVFCAVAPPGVWAVDTFPFRMSVCTFIRGKKSDGVL